ncbi:FlhB/HrpN/YscU/SpaS family protein [Hyphomonas neptunium ATCC 15444]|uniref:FlhB/HrpN/YscU/SpaS family protein n=2 Tax=Hyphomonas TaxID=85 RepID=Q0C5I7_HYPNA|nr:MULTISPECIES: flagellar type III secretion system protein FlhB [Hyphomonas]ABI77973.1 FlhB/HrpN/YscU/SpaS family protein [Hyphomonas neptunium ATCC 15444]KCZ95434.1 FlhB/HrpN/YscU/SpaS family protein [Hyphomonas hirschiana VP5]
MAEQDQDSGEKEFDASEQRLRDARKDGDVPQSKEANAFALILGILIAALILDAVVGPKLFDDFSRILYHGDAFAADIFEGDGGATWAWIATTLLALSPLLLVMAALVLVALIIQQSIAFSAKKIMPDMKKINPVDNIKNKYGTKGLTDFLKDTVKMLFAAGLGTLFLIQFTRDYYGSSSVDTADFYQFTFNQTLRLILYFFAFQFVLAALDLPLQWRIHSHKLRMTREDMKKEMKQSEGDPHMRQQRREKATKISRGQMLQNVKSATVVMVNPTHYAVALKWDPDSKLAPVCVAKGTDHLAMKIRELAIENNVPIYSDPPATRSIYSMVEVDQEIQAEHFAAVAAAIQFVDRLRGMT